MAVHCDISPPHAVQSHKHTNINIENTTTTTYNVYRQKCIFFSLNQSRLFPCYNQAVVYAYFWNCFCFHLVKCTFITQLWSEGKGSWGIPIPNMSVGPGLIAGTRQSTQSIKQGVVSESWHWRQPQQPQLHSLVIFASLWRGPVVLCQLNVPTSREMSTADSPVLFCLLLDQSVSIILASYHVPLNCESCTIPLYYQSTVIHKYKSSIFIK